VYTRLDEFARRALHQRAIDPTRPPGTPTRAGQVRDDSRGNHPMLFGCAPPITTRTLYS
jgi:hypothetical protein